MVDDAWLPLTRLPPLDLLVLAAATIAFAAFYARDYAKWGLLSFNSYFFGFEFFLKIVVMYPFALSRRNIAAIGNAFYIAEDHLSQAFYITLSGFLAMLAGMAVARATRARRARFCELVEGVLVEGWYTPPGTVVSAAISLALSLMLLILGFEVFHGRSLAFERTDLRPIFNLWSIVVPFCAINGLLFGAERRNLAVFASGLLVLGLGMIAGTRTVTILTLMQVAVIVCMCHRSRHLVAVSLGIVALIAAALGISLLRAGGGPGGESASAGPLESLLFGNNLSDLRDFAWMIGGLDANGFLLGKTYLAGYLDFIPSYLFEFRDRFSFGRISAGYAGLDPTHHGGLRPPIFGEMFMNFGWPGVAFGGVLYGYMVGRVMRWVSQRLQDAETAGPYTAVWTGFLMLEVIDAVVFTPAFYGVYVLLGLLLLGHFIARARFRFA